MYYGFLISWSSKVQQVIASSTLEAKYMAGTESAREVLWLRNLRREVGETMEGPTRIFSDNTGYNAIAKNAECHQRTTHIEIRGRFINALVEAGKIQIIYIPTDKVLADGMTKPLVRDKHNLH